MTPKSFTTNLILITALFAGHAFAQNNLHDFSPSAGGNQQLFVAVGPGEAFVGTTATAIPRTVLTLSANTTNYIYVDLVGGTVTSNTSGFTSTSYPIAIAVTNNTSVSSLTDVRPGAFGASASTGTGTVTSVATAGPITGGTITTTGTIACASCVTSSSPGAGLAHFAGSTQAVTSSAVSLTADVSGVLPIANGGTATATAAQNSVFAGPASGGAAAPTFQTAPTISAANMTSFPTFNQNTTGTSGGLSGSPAITVSSCTGCTSGLSGLATNGALYAASASTAASLTPPTTNGLYNVVYNVTGAASLPPIAVLPGFSGRAVTGTTATDTVLYSDNVAPVKYQGSVAVAVTLPTATTLGNAGFAVNLVNNTSGSSTAVTVTPTTWTVNGGATLVIAQGQACKVSTDPSGTNWDAECHDLPTTFSSPLTPARAQYGLTVTCPTCVTSAGSLTSTDIMTGAGSQGSQTPSSVATLNSSGQMAVAQLLASGIVDGKAPITVTTGTTATLGAGTYQSGYTFNQEATAATAVTYTLPATAVGLQYCVRNSIVSGTGAADTGVLTVYPPASSFVILNGVRNTVGGGGTHGVASGGAAGDSACFVAIDATDWEVYVIRGTWTAN